MPTDAVLMKSRLTLNFCETMCLAYGRLGSWFGLGLGLGLRLGLVSRSIILRNLSRYYFADRITPC